MRDLLNICGVYSGNCMEVEPPVAPGDFAQINTCAGSVAANG